MPTHVLAATRCRAAWLLAVIAAAGLFAAHPSTAEADRSQELIDVLQSDAPPAEKAMACKLLAIDGDESAVPALAALLPDPELCSWARIGLEAIAGPAADAALREAATFLTGRNLIGVINSLGMRRDRAAVALLRQRLEDEDPQVVSAAIASLGKIGGAEATAILQPLLASAPDAIRSVAAEALVLCAEQLLSSGQAGEAAALYDRVRGADVPMQRQIEATRGAILARGEEGLPLLVEQLQSSDRERFRLGLGVACEMGGDPVAAVLTEELRKVREPAAAAPHRREVPLLYALAEVAGAGALPAILPIARQGSAEARLAAVDVLGQVGDGRAIPALLEAAQEPGDLGKRALESLNKLEGAGVDAAVAEGLATAQGPIRVVLIRLVGYRRIESAVPELLKAANSDAPEVRLAALGALGRTVDFARLGVLIDRLADPRDAVEAAAVRAALTMAVTRMPDRNATAARLLAAMPGASTEVQVAVLELLAAVGGETAIAGVSKAAAGGDDTVRDAASRVLGQWMSPDVAPALLHLAATLDDPRYKLRALRGYLRIARQFQVPLDERTEMARKAIELAWRPDEKKLALEVLGRYPSVEGLKLAVTQLGDPTVTAEAAAAAVAIAEDVVAGHPAAVATAMKQVAAAGVDGELAAQAAALRRQAERQK